MGSEANSSFAQPSIPKFDGDYDHWSMVMENLLRSKEYWTVVESGYSQPDDEEVLTAAQRKTLEEMKLKDLKAKNYLFQSLDKSILKTITQKETSKQLWESMKMKCQGNARVQRAQLNRLRRDFEVMAMKQGESITDYFGRVMVVANDMRNCGEDMTDVKIVEKIMRTLTEKWNYIVCSIEEAKDIDRLSVDALQSSLLVHEQKFKKDGEEEHALTVSHDEGYGGRGHGRTTFRGGRGRGRGRQNYNKATVECYRCHQLGHFRYECPSSKQANYAELDESEETVLMACVELHGVNQDDVWFLDSGCSNHMCGDSSLFCELEEGFKKVVRLGNHTRLKVVGKGSVRLFLNGVSLLVKDVFYVPELKSHLLSVGQLQEKGLAVLMQSNQCRIYHPTKGLIIHTNMTANRMFVLLSNKQPIKKEPKEVCLQATTQDLAHLWHRRYGHLSYKGLQTLQSKAMVRGLPSFPESKAVCTDCLKGKQHRAVIPKKSIWRASEKLELVHADICGPISPNSNSHKRYLICFIDDFSRKAWVHFLVYKADAFASFKLFKSCVEKETGLSIKCLRTDRGGEFTSSEFNDYCSQNGIKRQLTTAHTPQQNGVAERKNRTVMNMVRSLLIETNVPKTFWPEAVNWTFYVLNRCPTSSVKDMTPEEAWSGVKPSVDHFRVFGCIAHAHVPDARRTKLEDKSRSCVLFGVSKESKGYRLYDPVSKQIVISRDVIFEEEKTWNWDASYEEQIQLHLEWGDEEHSSEEEENEETEGSEEIVPTSRNLDVPETSHAREIRNRRAPVWMADYFTGDGLNDEDVQAHLALITGSDLPSSDPISFDEAVQDGKWRQAMDSEMSSIKKNGTWFLTDLPKGAKRIGVKWVYKTKLNELGEVEKHKARLVAKGYAQEHGVDYEEVYAPVARMDTVRMILALAAQRGWTVFQLDVKSAFLHGELIEDVYVEQPRGYEMKNQEEKVYKLSKALYGLKQAPRAWFSRIESYFKKEGFEKDESEQTLFTKINKQGKRLIISLYVDDLIYTGDDEVMMREFKDSMMKEFDMSDLGKMRYFLGIEVVQFDGGIFISQKKYVMEMLKKFGMEDSNSVQNPIIPGFKISKDENGVEVNGSFYKQLVGSMMYLTATRPDIMYAVSLLSRYMSTPTELHLSAAKRVLRYLQGTIGFGILYQKGGNKELVGFTDSDYAGCVEDRKSTSGYAFILSGAAVAWSSRKQPIVTLSTTEAEFVAAAACTCHLVWMKRVLKKIGYNGSESPVIFCDNSSTIKLSRNPVMHGRSKHIDVRFHFLRDLVNEGVVQIQYCCTQQQIADIFTKPLKLETFQELRKKLGVCDAPKIN